MDNFGWMEMAAIAVIALVVFGPERLPELARNTARFVARARKEISGAIEQLSSATGIDGMDEELRSIRADVKGVRDELRGVRSDVTRGLDGIGKPLSPGGPTAARAAAATGAASATTGSPSADGPAGPPPVDTEAT